MNIKNSMWILHGDDASALGEVCYCGRSLALFGTRMSPLHMFLEEVLPVVAVLSSGLLFYKPCQPIYEKSSSQLTALADQSKPLLKLSAVGEKISQSLKLKLLHLPSIASALLIPTCHLSLLSPWLCPGTKSQAGHVRH